MVINSPCVKRNEMGQRIYLEYNAHLIIRRIANLNCRRVWNWFGNGHLNGEYNGNHPQDFHFSCLDGLLSFCSDSWMKFPLRTSHRSKRPKLQFLLRNLWYLEKYSQISLCTSFLQTIHFLSDGQFLEYFSCALCGDQIRKIFMHSGIVFVLLNAFASISSWDGKIAHVQCYKLRQHWAIL